MSYKQNPSHPSEFIAALHPWSISPEGDHVGRNVVLAALVLINQDRSR